MFLRPRKEVGVRDVMAAMRDHFQGTKHDCYAHQNPDEKWRPILLLRTGNGHIMRLRPASADLPDALSAIMYVAVATQGLSVYLPIYKGLPGDALPPELTSAGPDPDCCSLFWKARRLQALVFQDWPALAPPAMAAIREFEQRMEEEDRPAFERRYKKLLKDRDESGARDELVAFTAGMVRQASDLLVVLTSRAAAALGLPEVPPDSQLVSWLDAAAEAYSFEPWHDPYNGLKESHAKAATAAEVMASGRLAGGAGGAGGDATAQA